MGFNILGIATSIRTENITELTNQLGLTLSDRIGTCSFEEAVSSEIGEDELILTTTSKGSIITVGESVPIFDIPLNKFSENGKALKFMIGETAMVFGFEYYENGKLLRSVMSVEDRKVQEKGQALEAEYTGSDLTDIIFTLIGNVTGESIDTLELDTVSLRYKYIATVNNIEEIPKTQTPPTPPASKPWWKFW